MSRPRRWTCLACCLLLCLSATGCSREKSAVIGSADRSDSGHTESHRPSAGGSTPTPSDARQAERGSATEAYAGGEDAPEEPDVAPGAPLNEDDDEGGTAIAAPITIPNFTVDGAPFNEEGVQLEIEEQIAEACGEPEPCLNYAAEVELQEGAETCIIIGLPSGTAERGTTIIFKVAAPCASDEPPPVNESETVRVS